MKNRKTTLATSVAIVDRDDGRRRALSRVFSGPVEVFCTYPGAGTILKVDTGSGKERCVDGHVAKPLLCLRHLEDAGVGTEFNNSVVTIYYGGSGPGDLRFWGDHGAGLRFGLPRTSSKWPDGPPGYFLPRSVGPQKGVPDNDEVRTLLEWARSISAGESPPMPHILRDPTFDQSEQLVLALSVLCQGCLVVEAQSGRHSSVMTAALRTMGWYEFAATDLAKEVSAIIKERRPVVLEQAWWRDGLGGRIPVVGELGDGVSDNSAVGKLMGRLQETSGATSAPRLEPDLVAAAFLTIWRHLAES